MSDLAWQAMGEVFNQVFDLPEDQRRLRLDQLCPDDRTLRQEVESLVRAHQLAEHFTQAGFTVSVGELSTAARGRWYAILRPASSPARAGARAQAESSPESSWQLTQRIQLPASDAIVFGDGS